MNDHDRYPNCVLETVRFFDSATNEWGYAIDCLAYDHTDQPCPAERELFRFPRT